MSLRRKLEKTWVEVSSRSCRSRGCFGKFCSKSFRCRENSGKLVSKTSRHQTNLVDTCFEFTSRSRKPMKNRLEVTSSSSRSRENSRKPGSETVRGQWISLNLHPQFAVLDSERHFVEYARFTTRVGLATCASTM